MSSEEPQQRQRTVAELLAQHGSGQNLGEPRRRRRRAEDTSQDTAPQSIIERVRSDSGYFEPMPPEPNQHRAGANGTLPPRRPVSPPASEPAGGSSQRLPPVSPPVHPAPQHTPRPEPPSPQQPPRGQPNSRQPAPPPPQRATASRPGLAPVTPPPAPQGPGTLGRPPAPAPPNGLLRPGPDALADRGAPPLGSRPGMRPVPAEPMTEQLSAIPDAPRRNEPPAGLGAPPGGHRRREAAVEQTMFSPAVEDADDDDDGRDGYGVAGTSIADRLSAPAGPGEDYADGFPAADEVEDYPAGFPAETYGDEYPGGYAADYGEDEFVDDADQDAPAVDAAAPGPARQWLSVVGLIAGGVVGGAVVWLGFDWLWGVLPTAALIAALVVIVGMVWIVRKLRHADDPQTTVLAILVGLVVTVSPAALLLLNR